MQLSNGWTITIHQTGRPRDIDVVLYDGLRSMRSAARKHDNEVGSKKQSYRHTLGVCHGFERYDLGCEGDDPLVVILRFTRGFTTPEVVSHEVAHAAQYIYSLDRVGDKDLAVDHFSVNNEDFAHLLGEIFKTVWCLVGDK